jgi:hypothetical protein
MFVGGKIVHGKDKELMQEKAHGTTNTPVQTNLRWSVDRAKADEICCFNRHDAEHSGYSSKTPFWHTEKGKEVTFYDSVSGKPLFVAPRGRSWEEFEKESKAHGWPSFRDEEVVGEHARLGKR